MASSLETVCSLLMKTPEVSIVRERTRQRLAEAKVVGLSFRCDELRDGNNLTQRGVAFAVVQFGDDKFEFSMPGKDDIVLYEGHIIAEGDVNFVFNSNFGVPKRQGFKKQKVPTYNLGSKKALDEFSTTLKKQIISDLFTEKVATAKRITSEIRSALAKNEATVGKKEVVDRFMVEEIKKTLLRFKGASKEVLKTAFDEFIIHSIMED